MTPKTVMIVDDDQDDLELFCEALDDIDASLTCITAFNGEDALQKLRHSMEKLPDYVFLDLNMPRMDGKTCLGELKKDPSLKNIPVIIYTTSSHPREKEMVLQLGAAHFLTKASTFDRLKSGIEKALNAVDASLKSGAA